MRFINILITLIFCQNVLADEFVYILNDNCIANLYDKASKYFISSNIQYIRDSRGLVLRFYIKNPLSECCELDLETKQNLLLAGYFLAKIENFAIIEVHTAADTVSIDNNIKNWEIASVIAGKAESFTLESFKNIDKERIKSIGFGEFLPAKNTPYNGGKYNNHIDIIILCNVSGE